MFYEEIGRVAKFVFNWSKCRSNFDGTKTALPIKISALNGNRSSE